jgi:glycosyltransferase involved in cell wall biosynthesis
MNKESLPKVSIVIPVYNGEDYIEYAIQSVLSQDYTNIELIVLDDGSTDGTSKILNQFGQLFYWESHPNMGQASTLNKGWTLSKGQILSYLSADDMLLPTAVSTSVSYLEDHFEVIMTYCDYTLIDPDSNNIRRVAAPNFDYRDLSINMICQPGPGIFFRRSAFEKIGGWNPNCSQMPDYEYWLRLGLVGKLYRIPEVLASFRIHPNSQSYAKRSVDNSSEPVRIITEYFRRQDVPATIRCLKATALSNAHLISARFHWRSGRSAEAIEMLRRAFRADFKNILSIRSLRIIFNAMFNRFGHRLFWKVKKLYSKTPN